MPVLKSNFNVLIVTLVFLSSLLPAFTRAEAVDVYQHPLKDLRQLQRLSLSQLSSSAKIVVIFQPECGWCEKQIHELTPLVKQCLDHLQAVVIGSRGKRAALKRELKRYSADIPALQADRSFIRQLGGVVATPVTLFFDNKGAMLAKRRGYMPLEKLKAAIAILTKQHCTF